MNVNNVCDCLYGHTFLYVGAAYILHSHGANMELLHVNSSREEKPHMELCSLQFAPVLFVKFKVFIKIRTDVDVIAMIIKKSHDNDLRSNCFEYLENNISTHAMHMLHAQMRDSIGKAS